VLLCPQPRGSRPATALPALPPQAPTALLDPTTNTNTNTRPPARRLPEQVKAPHQRSGLSPQQYSHWLDSHGGDEVLRSVRGALAGAEARCKAEPAAAAAYEAMARLCGAAQGV
jgi:hypothetical protein